MDWEISVIPIKKLREEGLQMNLLIFFFNSTHNYFKHFFIKNSQRKNVAFLCQEKKIVDFYQKCVWLCFKNKSSELRSAF